MTCSLSLHDQVGAMAYGAPQYPTQRPFWDPAGSDRIESPQLSESSRSLTSNAENTMIGGNVRGFVFENGNRSASEKDHQKPKRRGVLNEKTRTRAGKMRLIGACWRCKVMKHQVSKLLAVTRAIHPNILQCSPGTQCSMCEKSGKMTALPCIRGSFRNLMPALFPGNCFCASIGGSSVLTGPLRRFWCD